MNIRDVTVFLEIAGKKGFLTQPVLKQTLTSLEKIKAVIDADPDKPEVDLRDEGLIEDLFRRFMTIFPGDISPESANVYLNRLKKAVENCSSYNQDPLSYKSTFGTTGGPRASKSTKSTDTKKKRKALDQKDDPSSDLEHYSGIPGATFLASFPLRVDYMLKAHLPVDLKTSEVKRLAFYLLSLCEDFNPVQSNIFYHEGTQQHSAIERGKNPQ